MKINAAQPFQTLKTYTQLGLCLLLFTSTVSAQLIQKKLIELGWDKPDAASLRKNIKQMEQSPFNGVIVNVKGTNDKGETISFYHSFHDAVWKKEYFQDSINDLKAVQSDKLTDNFLQLTANPGNVDWFDDAGWKQIVDHWRIAAEVAKEGGLKGIAFDSEPYIKPYKQFAYATQPQRDQHSFEEYQAKVRQRGREVINAVASVDPHLIILTTRMLSDVTIAAQAPSPQMALASERNWLWNLCPAFFNGWLDAAPPTMIFVEGTEIPGYHANSYLEFLTAGNEMRQTTLSLIAPENRQKFKAQVQVSFGIYLDGYITAPTSPWFVDSKNLTPTQRLHQNVKYAANVADEYVWIYGEKYRWWPTANKSVKPESWNDAMPGINDALHSAIHTQLPWLAMQKTAELEKQNKLINLLQNGDFAASASQSSGQQNVPAQWKLSQTTISKGIVSEDATKNYQNSRGGSVKLAGFNNGNVLQSIDVKVGQSYLVRAQLFQTGSGFGSILIRWQNKRGKHLTHGFNTVIYPPNLTATDKWQTLAGVVDVPEDAVKMVISLNAQGQATPDDTLWFDDAEAFLIP